VIPPLTNPPPKNIPPSEPESTKILEPIKPKKPETPIIITPKKDVKVCYLGEWWPNWIIPEEDMINGDDLIKLIYDFISLNFLCRYFLCYCFLYRYFLCYCFLYRYFLCYCFLYRYFHYCSSFYHRHRCHCFVHVLVFGC